MSQCSIICDLVAAIQKIYAITAQIKTYRTLTLKHVIGIIVVSIPTYHVGERRGFDSHQADVVLRTHVI